MFIKNVTELLPGVFVTGGNTFGGCPTFITSIHIGLRDVSMYIFNEKNYLYELLTSA